MSGLYAYVMYDMYAYDMYAYDMFCAAVWDEAPTLPPARADARGQRPFCVSAHGQVHFARASAA